MFGWWHGRMIPCRGRFRPLSARSRRHARIMQQHTRDWLEGLRGFAEEHRTRRAAQARRRSVDEPSAAARAAERGILGSHLVSWFDGIESLAAARRAFAPHAAADTDPAVVLTTSPVGLEAAAELCAMAGTPAASLRSRLVAVTELEYRLWCIREPDEAFRRHVNHWCWLKTDVPPQRHAEFAAHPLGPGECYWLHRTGTAGAGTADGRECQLWKWTGRHAALLQASIREGPAAPGA